MYSHARDPDIISVSDARGSLLTSLIFFLPSFRSTTLLKAPILFDTDPWSKCADFPVLDKTDDCPEFDCDGRCEDIAWMSKFRFSIRG